MKSIHRVIISEDFIALIFIFGVVLLFIMKTFNAKQLYGYITALFTQGFIEKTAEQKFSFLNSFYLLLQLFTIITIGLSLYFYTTPQFFEINYNIALIIISSIVLYFILKQVVLLLLLNLFQVKEELNYLVYTKNGYLYACCLLLFPFLVLYQYTFKSKIFLTTIICLLLIFRLFLIFKNNKKILSQHFFYFILYFCTLELAPLLLIYKTIT